MDAERSEETARQSLDECVNKLNEAVDEWNKKVVVEKDYSNSLGTAVSTYQEYLGNLNVELESHLSNFMNHVKNEESYGIQLNRLKLEFSEQVARERRLHEDVRARYESMLASMKSKHQAELQKAQRAGGKEFQSMVEQKKRAEVQLLDQQRVVTQLQSQLAASAQRSAEAEASQSRVAGAAKSLEAANARLKSRLQAAEAKLENELTGKIARMEQIQKDEANLAAARQAFEKDRDDIINRAAVAERETTSLRAQLSKLNRDQSQFHKSLERANDRLKEKLISKDTLAQSLKQEAQKVATLEEALSGAHALSSSRTKEIEDLRSQLNAALKFKADWIAEVKKRVIAEENEARAQAQVEAQIASHRDAIKAAEQLAEQKTQDLQAQLDTATTRKTRAEQQVQQLRQEVDSLTNQRGALATERDRLNTKLASLDELPALREKVKQLTERLQESQMSLTDERRARGNLSVANAQLEKQVEFLSPSKDRPDFEAQAASLQSRLAESLESRETLAVKLQQSEQTLAELRSQMSGLREGSSRDSLLASEWKQKLEDKEQLLLKEQEVNSAFISKEHSWEEKIAGLESRIEELSESLRACQTQLENSNRMLENAQKMGEERAKALRESREEVLRLRGEAVGTQGARESLHEAQIRVVALEQQLEGLTEQHMNCTDIQEDFRRRLETSESRENILNDRLKEADVKLGQLNHLHGSCEEAAGQAQEREALLTEKLEDARNELALANRIRNDGAGHTEFLQGKVDQLTLDLEAAEEEILSLESVLEDKNAEKDKRIEELETTLGARGRMLEELKAAVKQLRKDSHARDEQMRKTVEEAQSTKLAAEKELQGALGKVSEQESALQQYDQGTAVWISLLSLLARNVVEAEVFLNFAAQYPNISDLDIDAILQQLEQGDEDLSSTMVAFILKIRYLLQQKASLLAVTREVPPGNRATAEDIALRCQNDVLAALVTDVEQYSIVEWRREVYAEGHNWFICIRVTNDELVWLRAFVDGDEVVFHSVESITKIPEEQAATAPSPTKKRRKKGSRKQSKAQTEERDTDILSEARAHKRKNSMERTVDEASSIYGVSGRPKSRLRTPRASPMPQGSGSKRRKPK